MSQHTDTTHSSPLASFEQALLLSSPHSELRQNTAESDVTVVSFCCMPLQCCINQQHPSRVCWLMLDASSVHQPAASLADALMSSASTSSIIPAMSSFTLLDVCNDASGSLGTTWWATSAASCPQSATDSTPVSKHLRSFVRSQLRIPHQ